MFRAFWHNEDGWASIVALTWVIMVAAFTGIAIDITNAYHARTRLAAAADAAALAAATELPDGARAQAVALEYIEKNLPSSEYGVVTRAVDVQLGNWDGGQHQFFESNTGTPNAVRVNAFHSSEAGYNSDIGVYLLGMFGVDDWELSAQSTAVQADKCVKTSLMGGLTDYLFFFENASNDGNWQGATKGFVGNVAVDGVLANERTSGDVPYLGVIYTSDDNLGAWQDIIDQNRGRQVP